METQHSGPLQPVVSFSMITVNDNDFLLNWHLVFTWKATVNLQRWGFFSEIEVSMSSYSCWDVKCDSIAYGVGALVLISYLFADSCLCSTFHMSRGKFTYLSLCPHMILGLSFHWTCFLPQLLMCLYQMCVYEGMFNWKRLQFLETKVRSNGWISLT